MQAVPSRKKLQNTLSRTVHNFYFLKIKYIVSIATAVFLTNPSTPMYPVQITFIKVDLQVNTYKLKSNLSSKIRIGRI